MLCLFRSWFLLLLVVVIVVAVVASFNGCNYGVIYILP